MIHLLIFKLIHSLVLAGELRWVSYQSLSASAYLPPKLSYITWALLKSDNWHIHAPAGPDVALSKSDLYIKSSLSLGTHVSVIYQLSVTRFQAAGGKVQKRLKHWFHSFIKWASGRLDSNVYMKLVSLKMVHFKVKTTRSSKQSKKIQARPKIKDFSTFGPGSNEWRVKKCHLVHWKASFGCGARVRRSKGSCKNEQGCKCESSSFCGRVGDEDARGDCGGRSRHEAAALDLFWYQEQWWRSPAPARVLDNI